MSYEDTARMALDGEFLAALLDEYLDLLIEKNKLKKPTDEEIQKAREKVIKRLQEKYPKVGISLIKK